MNDGEAGEATVVSVRAKMFYHDKEAGWKERGGGMLKINVPQACVEFDDTGVVVPGSFDASGLDADEDEQPAAGQSMARLIMRQDQTHRVILNTALVPAMKFQEKASLKSVSILFTAFEGAQATPVSITMRVSDAAHKKSTGSLTDTRADDGRERQELHERDRNHPEGAPRQLGAPPGGLRARGEGNCAVMKGPGPGYAALDGRCVADALLTTRSRRTWMDALRA